MANYRPIATLNCLHKIYAAIIQKRIVKAIDVHIQKTQYGFRCSRSTSQAIYLARRIQYIAEAPGDNIILVFLDWEKPFDKVDQNKLIEALQRMEFLEKW